MFDNSSAFKGLPIVPKPDDVSHQNKPRREVHIGIIRVLLSDRSDLFTLAAGSVCFDFLLSPLVVAPIVCIYRISYILSIYYSCIV